MRSVPVAQSDESGDPASGVGLSSVEGDVLRLASAGRSNEEIARELGLTIGALRGHFESLMNKLNASTRRDLIGL